MPTVKFGFKDVPYEYEQRLTRKTRKGSKRKRKTRKVRRQTSTGEVADQLEAKYGIVEKFVEEKQDQIIDAYSEALTDALERSLEGKAPDPGAVDVGAEKVHDLFQEFIVSGEAERVGIPGTPTQAAMAGVSHKRVHPYSQKNPRRPSFYDTGLYVDNFMSWIDE